MRLEPTGMELMPPKEGHTFCHMKTQRKVLNLKDSRPSPYPTTLVPSSQTSDLQNCEK